MPPAPLPRNEAARLQALLSYDILDTACEHAFDDLARTAARLTGSPVALISLIDAERQWFKARQGFAPTETPRDQAFCGYAILDPGQQLVVPDATEDARFADNPLVTRAPNIRAYAGTPLVSPQGHALGTLCVIDTVPRRFDEEQLATLRSLAQAVGTTLELRRALRRAERMALTDGLTGMPNRQAFVGALEQAVARQARHGEPFALLCLDLDGFKGVNDSRGHAEGDRVLRAVGEVLTAATRREEMAARLGGDEFAVLLSAGTAMRTAEAAERIRRTIAARMDLSGWPVTASVGAVEFRSAPRNEAEALAAADERLYAAKRQGKNLVSYGVHHALWGGAVT